MIYNAYFWRAKRVIPVPGGGWTILDSPVIFWKPRNLKNTRNPGTWSLSQNSVIFWHRHAISNNEKAFGNWNLINDNVVFWHRRVYATVPNTGQLGRFEIDCNSQLLFSGNLGNTSFDIDGSTFVSFRGSLLGDFDVHGKTDESFTCAARGPIEVIFVSSSSEAFDAGVTEAPPGFLDKCGTHIQFDFQVGQTGKCITGSGPPDSIFEVDNYVF